MSRPTPTTGARAAAAPTPATHRIGARAAAGLVATSIAVTVVVFNNTAINLALPEMAVDLAMQSTHMRLVVVGYSVVFAALLLPAGWAVGRLGARRVLLAGLAVSVLGGMIALVPTEPGAGLPPGAPWLGVLIGRVILGAGAAMVMPSSLAVALRVVPAARRSAAIATWTAVSVAGAAAGPVLGGVVVSVFGWRWVFGVAVLAAVLALAGVLAAVPALAAERTAPLAGVTTALQVAGIVLVLAALSIGPSHPRAALVLGAVAAGAGLLHLRRRGPTPDGWAARGFAGAAVANALLFFAVAGSLFVLTQVLQYLFGFSAARAGLSVLPVTVAMITGTVLAGRLSVLLGPRPAVVTGLGVVTLACVVVALGVGTGPAPVIWAVAAAGLGVGIALPLVTEAMVDASPPDRVGDAAAVTDTMQEIGYSAGVAIIGGAFAAAFDRGLAGPAVSPGIALATAGDQRGAVADVFTSATQIAFGIAALVVAAGAAVAWWLLPAHDRRKEAP